MPPIAVRPLLRRFWQRSTRFNPSSPTTTFPAKAGIQILDYRPCDTVWVPAFAGKTVRKCYKSSLDGQRSAIGQALHLGLRATQT